MRRKRGEGKMTNVKKIPEVKAAPATARDSDIIAKMIFQDKEEWSLLLAAAEKIKQAEPQHFDTIAEVIAAALDCYLLKPVESKIKIIEMPSKKEKAFDVLLEMAKDIITLKHKTKITPYNYIKRILTKRLYAIAEQLEAQEEIKTFELPDDDE